MFLINRHADFRRALDDDDADTLGAAGADHAQRFLATRGTHAVTPLSALPGLAAHLGLGGIYVKDEGHRLGLGSFKALGGAYAVVRLVLEEAARQLGREIAVEEWRSADVRAVAAGMTFACATDGNHGRSVAHGARLVGARSAIFVHSGVSDARIAAIAQFGADMIRVRGTYDDSVAAASKVAAEKGLTVVSDTSWPGYERIPSMVMQGYTVMVREALRQMPVLPTHVFVQAGVGGVAAAVAGHLSLVLGDRRPTFVVVDPAKAACLFLSAKAGHPVKIAHGEPTIMAMLECYEPSRVAWRILSRVADAFMTVGDEDAVAAMRCLARPRDADPAIIAGESGGVGLAGLHRAMAQPAVQAELGLSASSHVLLFNTEGATDPERYQALVGESPQTILAAREGACA